MEIFAHNIVVSNGAKKEREKTRREFDGPRKPPYGSEQWKLVKTRPALDFGEYFDGTRREIAQQAIFIDLYSGGEITMDLSVAIQMGLVKPGEVARRRVSISTFANYIRRRFLTNNHR